MRCVKCQKETKNNKFCSQSCAAQYNNSRMPKRSLQVKFCKKCQNPIERENTKDRKLYCKTCKTKPIQFMKIKEIQQNLKNQKSKYDSIRDHARRLYKDKKKQCYNCGYTKHVEVCHIKAISSFDTNTLISEVNAESNIILLCPNCHWEFDNGLLNC